MSKIIVFGSNGMLGSYFRKYFIVEKLQYDLVCLTKQDINVDTSDNLIEKIKRVFNDYSIKENDIVINCIGLLKNTSAYSKISYVNVNIVFPHYISQYCNDNHINFIHISTDCVFSGCHDGYYNENEHASPTDLYGMSKYLGEPDNCMIIRTSIIGDCDNNRNLLSSLKNKKNNHIFGYKNCLWNGITCLELVKFIIKVVNNNDYWIGIRHVVSSQFLSKHEIIKYLSQLYNLNLNITENFDISCDRRLSTKYTDTCVIKTKINTQFKEQKKVDDKYNKIINSVGKYLEYKNCRSCNSSLLLKYVDFKFIPLAGGFIKCINDIHRELYYPFSISFCTDCTLSQSMVIVDNSKIFNNNYFYHSSNIPYLINHFTQFADIIYNLIVNNSLFSFLEIGCNDGVLLNPLTKLFQENEENKRQIIGIDPCKNVLDKIVNTKINTYNALFNQKVAYQIKEKHGNIDFISSSNCMAHIVDINEIISSVSFLLSEIGIFVIEVHYLPSLIKKLQYDFMYHEHQYYYTLHALDRLLGRHKINIYDCEFLDIHGGSIRIYATKDNTKAKSKLYTLTMQNEINENYTNINIYKEFFTSVCQSKVSLLSLLSKLRSENKTICGYGASGRATIITNFCNLDNDILKFVVDDSSIKHECFTPGNNLLIRNSDSIYECDYVLILAWTYSNDIIKKHIKYITLNNGKFIIPLPNIQIIDKDNVESLLLL